VVLSRCKDGEIRGALYYDPSTLEGTWSAGYPGTMVGYTQCLTAGIALQLAVSPDNGDLGPGIYSGLAASRDLHVKGFIAEGERAFPPNSPIPAKFAFPSAQLGGELSKNLCAALNTPERAALPFRRQVIPRSEVDASENWGILSERYPTERDVMALAKEIVEWGKRDTDWDIPITRFGKLLVTGRAEVESLRAMALLLGEYREDVGQKKPLSIAVFGAPGSGKSFTIKAVSESLSPTEKVPALTFNLSQFSQPGEILQSLHQVRDAVLSGAVPLVFWDEFDASLGGKELGWLRYFLAPMQDGAFQEGPLTHNIGRAVFVFAGGTRQSMKGFMDDVDKQGPEVKGSDFLSRLKGYVDISGLDHESPSLQAGVVIRRAVLLRSLLLEAAEDIVQHVETGQKRGKRLNLDPGVVRAFLRVEKYKYGARSMESVIRMSALKGKSMFERSSLPSEQQLSLHVDGPSFLKWVTASD
jgi:hypothetical protein